MRLFIAMYIVSNNSSCLLPIRKENVPERYIHSKLVMCHLQKGNNPFQILAQQISCKMTTLWGRLTSARHDCPYVWYRYAWSVVQTRLVQLGCMAWLSQTHNRKVSQTVWPKKTERIFWSFEMLFVIGSMKSVIDVSLIITPVYISNLSNISWCTPQFSSSYSFGWSYCWKPWKKMLFCIF